MNNTAVSHIHILARPDSLNKSDQLPRGSRHVLTTDLSQIHRSAPLFFSYIFSPPRTPLFSSSSRVSWFSSTFHLLSSIFPLLFLDLFFFFLLKNKERLFDPTSSSLYRQVQQKRISSLLLSKQLFLFQPCGLSAYLHWSHQKTSRTTSPASGRHSHGCGLLLIPFHLLRVRHFHVASRHLPNL